MFVTKTMIRVIVEKLREGEEFKPTHDHAITKENLSDEDHFAIHDGINAYAHGHKAYNDEAHKTGKIPRFNTDSNREVNRIGKMDDAIRRNQHKIAIKGSSTVYHGMRREPEFDESGHTKVSGITSATTVKEKALTHANRAKSGREDEKSHLQGDTLHVLRIHSKSHHKNRPVYVAHCMRRSEHKNEHEAIFPSHSIYKKHGEELDGGKDGNGVEMTVKHPDTGKMVKKKYFIHYHDVEPIR
jgi:hypothetical protein